MRARVPAFALALLQALVPIAGAGDLLVRLAAPPTGGGIVAMLFDSPEGFEDFRAPARTLRVPADGRDRIVLEAVPPGRYALVVFHDENDNRRLDLNFIGIPREPVGFSSAYRPKGPPGFDPACFEWEPSVVSPMEVALARPLGRRGRIGVGAGVLARGSPYERSTGNPVLFLPAVTYIGNRVQILGPSVQAGLIGTGNFRLAASASYRMGVYKEGDSPVLEGLGDRRATAMAGLGLQMNAPLGTDVSASFMHDALDRIGGGESRFQLSRPIPWRRTRFTPSLSLNWTSSRLVRHDFGIPADRAAPGRPAYRPGHATSLETGFGLFAEITGSVMMAARIGIEWFGDEIRDSPIVDEDHVLKGMLFVTWML